MNTVYIIVEDGLVQTVYSLDPNTDVVLCDLDTFDLDERAASEKLIESLRDNAHQIY